MNENDDALTVARWCWPEQTWGIDHKGQVYSHGVQCFSCGHIEWGKDGTKTHMLVTHADIADAERVLIERGMAEAYGFELAKTCGLCVGYAPHYRGNMERDLCLAYAKAATASLDARVRAMAATIRLLA